MRTLIGALGLAALWLLMSGLWTKTLILIFGAISVIIALVIARRMDEADEESLAYTISPIATIKYTIWLLIEIAKSNLAVTKVILSGKNPDRQKLFHVPITQKCDLAQVVYANSITLTPGTITVETEEDGFIVHALDYSGDEDMAALGDMDARVTAIETADARKSY